MASRRLVVVAALVLLGIVVAACAPAATTPAPELPEAVTAAMQALSEAGDLSLGEIEVVSYEPQEWSDSCLGLGRANESCLQAITPGYQVVLRAGGEEIVFRTDETGAVVRREE